MFVESVRWVSVFVSLSERSRAWFWRRSSSGCKFSSNKEVSWCFERYTAPVFSWIDPPRRWVRHTRLPARHSTKVGEKKFFFFSFHPYRRPTLYSAPSFNLKIYYLIYYLHFFFKFNRAEIFIHLVYFYIEILWSSQLFRLFAAVTCIHLILKKVIALCITCIFLNFDCAEIFIHLVYFIYKSCDPHNCSDYLLQSPAFI